MAKGAKHTPGPWELADDGTIRARCWGQSDQMADYRGVVVCDLKAGTGCGEWPALGRKHAQAEAEANGHLIAAAPDLLAALKDVLGCWLEEVMLGQDLDQRHPAVSEAAIVAIRRAEGRS